jgi:hypothetical protein
LIIIRAHDEETEYTITAKELAKLEALARKKQGLAA